MRDAKRRLGSVAAALAALAIAPAARAEAPTVLLYTVGPGSYTFAYYGHSALCVREAGAAEGRCFDYGLPATETASEMVWGSLRGRPIFVPVGVPEAKLVAVFREQDRTIERETLSLGPDEADRVAAALDAAADGRVGYAYHPWSANCTTQLRDVLDAATTGKLRRGADAPTGTETMRDLAEQGMSGRPLHLAAVAIGVGVAADRRPTEWERMFLPVGLRDAARARLGAEPETVHRRDALVLPTSRAVGRAGLVLLGAGLAFFAWRGARHARPGRDPALVVTGLVLGALALLLDVWTIVARFPEVPRNWALAALLPTDLALGWLPPRWLERYLAVRLATLALLGLLSLVGAIAQPLAAVALLAALPLGAAYLGRLRQARRAPASARA